MKPAIDALEFARGTLSSTSFVATDTARETHITRLQDRFDRAGIAASMTDALKTLQFLREAEPLDNGYWIPAPTRVVDLGSSHWLLIGIPPTAEFHRHFSSVRRAGAARVVDAGEVADLPRQSVRAWRGHDGYGVSTWARTTIESAMPQLAASVVDESIEAFGTRSASSETGRRQEPVWIRPGDDAACTWRGVGLFRARTGATGYRYFLGQHQVRSAFLEGPAVREPTRMQFGLAALEDRALTTRIATSQDAVSISLPLRAPTAMQRLLVALCDADMRSFGRTWICRTPESLPALQASLQELDCEIVHHE